MNTHTHKKQDSGREAAANAVAKNTQKHTAFQFEDNRPQNLLQRKVSADDNESVSEDSQPSVIQNNNDIIQQKSTGEKSDTVYQLGRKRSRREYEEDNDSSDDEYLPPAKRRKHRQTFSKKLRKKVIKRTALKNKSGLHVCRGCGMPLADKNGNEIKTYYKSKSGKRHNIVSAQMDHFPTWSKRLSKLKKKKKSDEEIREDHDDPTRLRALCLRCNASHKYENTKTEDLPDEGYSDEEYYSDDSERDKEIWKHFRKDDHDKGGGGTGVTA